MERRPYDNGVAVLYDNNYVGYACGFGSDGSVEVEFIATGGPGSTICHNSLPRSIIPAWG